MKRLLHIFIGVILFALSACQRETTYPLAMQQADSLMNTRPDLFAEGIYRGILEYTGV